MISVSKSERIALEKAGLLRHKRVGYNACDPNFYVANKEHIGRNKRTYVVEEPNIMKFLGHYENQNLQRINDMQYNSLVEAGIVNEGNTQAWGTFNPRAICYVDAFGDRRVAKIAPVMLHLGLWKDNKRKKMAKAQNKLEQNQTVAQDTVQNPVEEPVTASDDQGMPDINEQGKALGMPQVIFREVETGEVVKAGSLAEMFPMMRAMGITEEQVQGVGPKKSE